MRAPRQLLDLRPGEGRTVFLLTCILAGLIGAHTMLETARDALFLGKLQPAWLTLVYGVLAGITLLANRINGRFVMAFGRRNALVCTLIVAAFGTVVFFLLPKTSNIVFGLYIWSALLGTVLVVQFWMLAGHIFTVTQGKRLFGFIAAGGVLGAVLGATSSIAITAMGSVEVTLAVGSTVFLATSVALTLVDPDEVVQDVYWAKKEQREQGWKASLQSLKGQPYLLRLGLFVAFATMTVLVTDFLFKSVAAREIMPENLGGFFARYYAILNSIALVMQLFVSGYLVRRTGTIVAALVLPALLVLGAAGILVAGGALAAVLLTKGADGALRHSLHRISLELLWMPIPEQKRSSAKGFIDAVVVRGSQAVAAGGLFVLGWYGLDAPLILAGLVIALALVWMCLGLSLRRPYLDLFRSAIHRGGPDAGTELSLDLRSVEVVVEALSSRESERVLAALELLAANGRTRLIPGLILYHESDEVLRKALEFIATKDRKDWVPLTERLLTHPNEAVRVSALKALARAGYTEALEGRLLDVSPSVRGQAAFWLAQMSTYPNPGDYPAVDEMAQMTGPAGASALVGILEAVRDSGDERWAQFIARAIEHDDTTVSESAISATATVKDARFIEMLIADLDKRNRRGLVRDALVLLGDPAQAALERALVDHSRPKSVRLHVPRSISKFRNQRAADVLVETLSTENDGAIRYKAIRGLGRLISHGEVRVPVGLVEDRIQMELTEYLRMLSHWCPISESLDGLSSRQQSSGELLANLIEDKMRQAVERAFRLLQIAHPMESIRSVALAIQSNDKKVRAQAQEYIDALTLASGLSQVRELLRIIGDDLPPRQRLNRARAHLEAPPQDASEAIRALIRESDEALAGLAAYHALELGEQALRDDVVLVSEERSRGGSLKSFIELLAAREEPTGVV